MLYEEELQVEAKKLREELAAIDAQLAKLYAKTSELLDIHKKKEHDLRALLDGIEQEIIRKQEKEALAKISGRHKIKVR